MYCSGLNISSSGTDWVEQFPLHKFACEGDVAGIRHCMAECIETDPNVLDTDGWSPLHYACWWVTTDSLYVKIIHVLGMENWMWCFVSYKNAWLM